MQFKDGWLWFATATGVYKSRDTNNDGVADEIIAVLPEGTLPGKTGHWFRSLLVTGDAIYTGVGDSSNISDETQTERQKIWSFNLSGGGKTLFASGIRNTEELQVRPGTSEIWGFDHNSDDFGAKFGETMDKKPITDLNPPEEFNRYVEGGFYGHPFLVGNRVPRPEFADRKDIVELAAKTMPPEFSLPAHWAINGWTFLTTDAFAGHKGDAIAAAHGSWNSSKKVGYRVECVMFDPWTGKPYGSQLLVSTLAKDGETVLARPCDVVEAPDGSVYFSDDANARIFRLAPEKLDENRGH
jgi:glucose/arabinose dehydrogenase